jgi:hypothetical protein
MSKDWKPVWIREHRAPMFITKETDCEEFTRKRKEEFSTGMSLYVLLLSVFPFRIEDNKGGGMRQQWMSLIWPAMRTTRRRIFPLLSSVRIVSPGHIIP